METTKQKLDDLSGCKSKLTSTKNKLEKDKKSLSDSTLHKSMLKMKQNTDKMNEKYNDTLEDLEIFEEFKNIYDKDCKNCIIDRMRNIQSEANDFLSSLETKNLMQIRLDYNDGIKITAIKNSNGRDFWVG